MADMDDDRMQELQDSLKERIFCVACDVGQESEVKNAIEKTVAKFGTIHVALACAGIPWPTPTLTSQGPFNSEIFEKVIRVNVMGSVYMAKYAAVAMSKNRPFKD